MKKTVLSLLIISLLAVAGLRELASPIYALDRDCGSTYSRYDKEDLSIICTCASGEQLIPGAPADPSFCCGWYEDHTCHALSPEIRAEQEPGGGEFIIDPDSLEVTQDTLDAFNPLKTEGSEYADQLSTPRGIISRFFQFAFPIAGMILFVLLVWGGFSMMTGAASKKSIDSGKQIITAAIVGFLLLFISYWIAQILEAVFGIDIFGN
jgi:Type IV secretion system pilin